MINIGLPIKSDDAIYLLAEILRRSVDGTVAPLFVDYTNSRVLMGSTTASSSPAISEVHNGDLKVVSSGFGMIVPNAGGTAYCRITWAADGAGNPTLVLTPL